MNKITTLLIALLFISACREGETLSLHSIPANSIFRTAA